MLPRLSEVGDPVLAAIWGGGRGPEDVEQLGGPRPVVASGAGHIQVVNGERHVYLYRRLDNVGEVPWFVLFGRDSTPDLGRRRRARCSRPIKRIASAANTIFDLRLDVDELPRSRIRELDDQARAFNAMVNGLRWFQNYVPRRLVERLLEEQSDDGGIRSLTREITVIFTDVVGFTAQFEAMDAKRLRPFSTSTSPT